MILWCPLVIVCIHILPVYCVTRFWKHEECHSEKNDMHIDVDKYDAMSQQEFHEKYHWIAYVMWCEWCVDFNKYHGYDWKSSKTWTNDKSMNKINKLAHT